jgi:ABC-2 type transport system permease protein
MSVAPAAAPVAKLQPVEDRGWRRGLPNLLSAGFRAWWGTSTWWIQLLIWIGVTNVPLAALLWSDAEVGETEPLTVFAIMAMFTAVAVAIIMQDEIVGEKKSGTAAWVLSKPVSRTAFVVAKLVPNGVGMLATMVVAPGIVAYVLASLRGLEVDPIGYVGGLAVIGLNLVFYLTLTLMLGTMLSSAGAVIGIALAFAFGQQFLVQIPPLAEVIPWALVAPLGQSPVSDASALMVGAPVPAPMAIVVAAAASVLFVTLAVRQFDRAEF